MSGASISPSAPVRATTKRRARCSQHSTFRSGSEGLPPFKRGTKERLDGEEEFDREEQPAAEDVEAIRKPPSQAQGNRAGQEAAGRGALCGDPQAGDTAAQFLGHPHPQSL